MSAIIKENIIGKIVSSENNRLKLLNFTIPTSMVYHKISINKNDNTIVHNYKIIDNAGFLTLNDYINRGTQLISTNTNLHPTQTQTIASGSEISTCRINQNIGNNISTNQFKIASCQIKTATQIT